MTKSETEYKLLGQQNHLHLQSSLPQRPLNNPPLPHSLFWANTSLPWGLRCPEKWLYEKYSIRLCFFF